MMSIVSRRELLGALATRYRNSSRSEKTAMLDEFIQSSGYARKYAIGLLGGPATPPETSPRKRRGAVRYGRGVRDALVAIWYISGCICGKRLVPALEDYIEALERFKELAMTPAVRALMIGMSASTADRLLRDERKKTGRRGLSTTKTGTLLKKQIAIRLGTEWDDAKPGYLEIDLVAHCGDTTAGVYVCTLTLTDICTGWTVCMSLVNRSQIVVRDAIDRARSYFPFPILAIDSDNGTEFINRNLQKYCQENKLGFTRCRPYHKNDQCHVEQKNGNIVRLLVGYDRFEGAEAAKMLDRLYRSADSMINYFQPSMKLVGKHREGAKIHKEYDTAQTPYGRIKASKHLNAEETQRLDQRREKINPAKVRRDVEALREAVRAFDRTPMRHHDAPPADNKQAA
jgi:hypothetical protein